MSDGVTIYAADDERASELANELVGGELVHLDFGAGLVTLGIQLGLEDWGTLQAYGPLRLRTGDETRDWHMSEEPPWLTLAPCLAIIDRPVTTALIEEDGRFVLGLGTDTSVEFKDSWDLRMPGRRMVGAKAWSG